jgi:hypothetical protein
MAAHRGDGTLITLFRSEKTPRAQDMGDDGMFKRIAVPDVALVQPLLPGITGTVTTRPGQFTLAADSGPGSIPQRHHRVDQVRVHHDNRSLRSTPCFTQCIAE